MVVSYLKLEKLTFDNIIEKYDGEYNTIYTTASTVSTT